MANVRGFDRKCRDSFAVITMPLLCKAVASAFKSAAVPKLEFTEYRSWAAYPVYPLDGSATCSTTGEIQIAVKPIPSVQSISSAQTQ